MIHSYQKKKDAHHYIIKLNFVNLLEIDFQYDLNSFGNFYATYFDKLTCLEC